MTHDLATIHQGLPVAMNISLTMLEMNNPTLLVIGIDEPVRVHLLRYRDEDMIKRIQWQETSAEITLT